MEDSNGEERLRLLIMRNGERRGVMILDSKEEGEEIIARLNGGLIKSSGHARSRAIWIGKLRKMVEAVKHFDRSKLATRPSIFFRFFDRERLTWATLVVVSWAVAFTFVITRSLL